LPEIVGTATLPGGSGNTTAVFADTAGVPDPSAFDAVSVTRIVCPASLD